MKRSLVVQVTYFVHSDDQTLEANVFSNIFEKMPWNLLEYNESVGACAPFLSETSLWRFRFETERLLFKILTIVQSFDDCAEQKLQASQSRPLSCFFILTKTFEFSSHICARGNRAHPLPALCLKKWILTIFQNMDGPRCRFRARAHTVDSIHY